MTDNDDKLSFLDQPRDDGGRFASRQEAAPVDPAPQPEPAQVQPPEPVSNPEPIAEPGNVEPAAQPTVPPGYIPYAQALDEREKRQASQRDADEWKRKYEEATKKAPEPLDPIADPEGFERQLQDRFRRAEWDATTRVSLGFAVRQHGAETVKAAEEWVKTELQSNPAFFQTIERQSDPYDFVVRQQKISQRNAKLGDEVDIDAAFEKWAAERGYQRTGQAPQSGQSVGAPSPTQTAPLPRPSLATAPAAGLNSSRAPVGDGVAFDGLFKR